jgi:hypothetical protein
MWLALSLRHGHFAMRRRRLPTQAKMIWPAPLALPGGIYRPTGAQLPVLPDFRSTLRSACSSRTFVVTTDMRT